MQHSLKNWLFEKSMSRVELNRYECRYPLRTVWTGQTLMKCCMIMPHHAAFHLRPHCLSKYLFAGIQNEKGYPTYGAAGRFFKNMSVDTL